MARMSAFEDRRDAGGLPKAVVISGAGTPEANGIYKATTTEYCDAPVYEHMERGADLKITREPHTNPKTGKTKHGWLLGLKKTPLYGAPSESLSVPAVGWKQFSGEPPLPTVKVHQQITDVFFAIADDAKTAGDEAVDREDWNTAVSSFTEGVDALKRSGERFGEDFKNRAAFLLARRAAAHANLQEPSKALRDAVAALELVRGLASAEAVAVESAKRLGCKDDASARRLLEPVGAGRILDTGTPLVLRCVERWIRDAMPVILSGEEGAKLPAATHMQADRYLDGVDEETRNEILKKYIPELDVQFGGNGIIQSARDCLSLMKRWEEVLAGDEFQRRRKELWDRKDLSFPGRLKQSKLLIAESLANVLEPAGFAPGLPGLTRCVGQMQHYWSQDQACARKAYDLEELADVCIADLA